VEILNLGGAQENSPSTPKSRKPLRVLLGIGALAAVTGIGSTLAANITLNGSNLETVEFGQGVVTTAACDSSITVTPVTAFVNDPTNSYFELDTIDLSDVDALCANKWFVIRAYDNNAGSSPLAIFNGADYLEFQSTGTSQSADAGNTGTGLDIENVFKFTIESFDVNQFGV
jgi:hypothetical protein